MYEPDDREYHLEREREERAAVALALSEPAKRAHRELAERHALLAQPRAKLSGSTRA